MNCTQFGKYSKEYLAGALDDRLRREFESHLQTCVSCAEKFARKMQAAESASSGEENQVDSLFKQNFTPEPPREYWETLPGKILERLPSADGKSATGVTSRDWFHRLFTGNATLLRFAGGVAVLAVAFYVGRSIFFSSADRELLERRAQYAERLHARADSSEERSEALAAVAESADERPAVDETTAPAVSAGPENVAERMATSQGGEERAALARGEPPAAKDLRETAKVAERQRAARGMVTEASHAEGAGLQSVVQFKADKAPYDRLKMLQDYLQNAQRHEPHAEAVAAAQTEVEETVGVAELAALLLSGEEYVRANEREYELDYRTTAQDSLTVAESVFVLARFYFTRAILEKNEETRKKALDFWMSNKKLLSGQIGGALTEKVIELLILPSQ